MIDVLAPLMSVCLLAGGLAHLAVVLHAHRDRIAVAFKGDIVDAVFIEPQAPAVPLFPVRRPTAADAAPLLLAA